ncbi:MAG: HAD-IIIC family phosphatase [Clostridia bacterium]|nr:HAD-IIIC family phosphatase [Clostridia bacterium]
MRELEYPFDSELILQNRRKLRKALIADGSARIKKNIAVLGGSTTHDIIAALELFLLNQGIEPSFYESEYAQYYQDAMFGNQELDEFHPDIIFVHTSLRNINVGLPSMSDSREQVKELIDSQVKYFEGMWEKLRSKFNCPIIQNNFEMPFYRLLGNKDAQDYRGRTNFVTELNRRFYEYADEHNDFYIHDINYISAAYGLEQWSDPFYWYMYKYCLCLPAIPEFAFNLSNIIKSIFGKNKKALVLDLDNTLWSGVVGDDGVDGIDVGQETSVGQGFYEFQTYLKAHKQLGILLNVASKNDHENAIAGLNHPSGVLRPDDFTIIKANWDAKSENLKKIASELSLLPESLVFVDDNPAEREIVRAYVPGVAVPEVNKVEEYIRNIDRGGYFEVTTFSADDASRVEMYRQNIMRAQAQESFTDYNEYLLSLEMHADIKDFEPLYLARITQLTNKSNQFNLTTKRFTESEMEAVAADDKYVRLYGRLVDKFGDNGIVSVVIGRQEDNILHMELWLMSCRVLKRDMEQAMLDEVVRQAQKRGIREIRGYYYPTAKNKMVEKLYETFGFTLLSSDDVGNTVWSLMTEGYEDQNKVIKVN